MATTKERRGQVVVRCPLKWPSDITRRAFSKDSPFNKPSLIRACYEIEQGLIMLKSTKAYISCNLQFNPGTGKVYGSAPGGDKGAAVYYRVKGTWHVFTCDMYTRLIDNLYAIGKALQMKHRINKYGVMINEVVADKVKNK